MRQNGSNLNGRSGARPTARRDLGQLPSGQRQHRRKPGAMYLNHSRGFSDRSARIGNGRSPRRPSHLPYALIAVGCALVLFIAAVVGYVNRSVDVELNGQKTAVRVGSTLQNLIDDQSLTETYDAGEQSGKTQDRGEVVPATDCVVECASVAPKGNEKYVALTFDEGPSGATKQILQVLKEKGVTATFFLSGDAAEASPATAKAIVDAGCEIGSNSYSHDSLKGEDRETVRKQITRGTEAIKSATGVETMLLRAPYAAFDEQNWIDSMDLVSAVVSWNIDSGDWLLNGADEQVSTVLDSVTPGNIVLLTDSDECAEQTLEALPQIIDGLVADGYKIVTLSDLVKTDTALSKKLTSLTKVSMPKNAVFPQLPKDDDTAE